MPILRESELDIISHSVEQTQRLGVRLGALIQPGDIVCLSGDMGAGKTMFSIGIGRGWGSHTQLTSPTYNLIHEHRHVQATTKRLYHLDCYRLTGPDEAEQIGLDDILDGQGPVILEWPEHIEEVLPANRLWIELRILEPTRRTFVFNAIGDRYESLLKQFRHSVFGS